MKPTTSGFLIRTYAADAERLKYCLASIKHFCTGFDEIVVVCQERSRPTIEPIVNNSNIAQLKICEHYENDYIGQQITKLRAPEFLKSDLIFHLDSDCVFKKPYNPKLAQIDNLPALYHREYDYFYKNGIRIPWQLPTSDLIKRQVDFEFMALFPLVYHRDLYSRLEEWFQTTHGYNYEAIEQHLSIPNLFSEFNLLGAFSYYVDGYNSHIHLNWGLHKPEHFVRQYCVDGSPDRSILDKELIEIKEMLQIINE